MFKMIGALFILTGCMAYGVLSRIQMQLHIRQLKQAEKVMESLGSEITYGKAALYMACRETAGRAEEPYAGFLQQVYEAGFQNEGQPFADIWKQEFTKIAGKLLLKEDEQELIYCFGACSGYMDVKLQESAVERLCREMGKRSAESEQECRSKMKIVMCLSAAGGMVLTMMLL
ncbi:MAG: stage III sporulation protein AB [Lachnospiraceae bacterium]|nr:stage III sporulation protein AB [Lachnospiraceae bacterium]